MVRVHWHVEDGFGAIIPVGGLIAHGRDTDVQHAICEIELPGQGTNVEACFTLPPDYTTPGKVSKAHAGACPPCVTAL